MPNKLSVAESRVLESIQGAAFDVPGVLPTARGLSHWGEHALGWMGSAAAGAGGAPRRGPPGTDHDQDRSASQSTHSLLSTADQGDTAT